MITPKFREGTYDEHIWKEVTEDLVYKRMTLDKNDNLLDIWANIGCYTILAADQVSSVTYITYTYTSLLDMLHLCM